MLHKSSDFNTILVVVNDQAKADRLMPTLSADGYRIEVVQTLTPPLPKLKMEPDLGIIWFPYASPDALPELENIVNAIHDLDPHDPLPVLLIIDQDGARWVEPSFRLGIADILTRPIHPLILRQRVRLLLKARQTERTIQQLKRKVEGQERQRMIHALDSALQMFRAESVIPQERIVDASSLCEINPQISYDPDQRCLIFRERGSAELVEIELTTDQASILQYMIGHPHRALSNREIAQAALGYHNLDEIQSRSIVRPHILRLRRKLESDSTAPEILRTVRGAGYIYSPD
jgi:DNA-binding response OmpR family regulator